MITVKEYTVKLPGYSLPYIINNDSSGLEESDIAIIDHWYNKLQGQADLFHCVVILSPSENDSYFTSAPEFGLPCDVTDCTVVFLQ